MEINESLVIGKYQIYLNLSSLHGENGDFYFQFGIGDKSLQKYGMLKIEEDFIEITTDFFSGQRIYYWQIENSVYITDSVYKYLTPEELESYNKSIFELTFFEKHGYTSGDATVYNDIRKIPPASSLSISPSGIELKSVWDLGAIVNEPSREIYQTEIYNSVKNNLQSLKNIDRPIVLCFSGGKDSTYLAYILNELEIDYDLVFLRDTTLKINNKEINIAKTQARRLGKELHVINIQRYEDEKIDNAINQFRRFDNHYCKVHYYGLAGIKEIYGSETIIINGQNSDSILSYGPSEEKFSSKVKRYLLYGKNIWIKRLSAMIIGSLFHTQLKVPITKQEYLDAFYDNFKYCLLLDKRTPEYIMGLHKQIDSVTRLIGTDVSVRNILMYLKQFTHMQASDAQVVTQSAKYHGFDLIMPLAESEIMRATLQYKDDQTELNYPKYPLDFVCKKLSQ